MTEGILPQPKSDPVLISYAHALLAKDLSGRYSNPGRTIQQYQNIMSIANSGTDIMQMMMNFMQQFNQQQQGSQLPQQGDIKVNETTTVHTKPKNEPQYVTKKQFYDFKNDIMAEFKKLAVASTPVAP